MSAQAATFSIVMPVFNEGSDIEHALASLRAQTVPPMEIIVVDDASTDGSKLRLQEWARRGWIRLIERERNAGAAAARNVGIEAARGDVVVFVDADNLLPSDFLERLVAKYEAGADCVSVESRVVNRSGVVGRFQQATHELHYGGLRNSGYTQCFSCRRVLAEKVRFPEELPMCGGDDVEFFERLLEPTTRWAKDPALVVGHIVPDTLGSFARQCLTRGRAVPFIEHRLHRRPLRLVIPRRAVASVQTAIGLALVVPGLVQSYRLARHSALPIRDLPAFWLLWHTAVVMRRLGEWRAIRAIRAGHAG